MSSGWLSPRRLRFDRPHSDAERTSAKENAPYFPVAPEARTADVTHDLRLSPAIERTRDWLLGAQHDDGYWVGELEGDTILESEYILLLAFLGRENSTDARLAANYLVKQQLSEGGWAIYPGGPLEISASVKAYFALKLTGHSPEADDMQRARAAVLQAGGAERVNSFTRYYLALLGIISYEQCPAVPPELVLIPNWMPFNIYEMSAWSRTIIVPLSLLWAYRPVRQVAAKCSPLAPRADGDSRSESTTMIGIDELFHTSPQELPVSMAPAEVVTATGSARTGSARKTWIDWDKFFRRTDRFLKFLERCRIRPLRQLAIERAADWMIARFDKSDGLGAIFPPIIWSVVALKCLGHSDDSPFVQAALGELEKLSIREDDTLRLEPCKSPVWDTALATIALRDAGVAWDAPPIRRAVNWLLSKEVRRKGDWATSNPRAEAGGWFFEFNNEFYPDVDDTIMVVMALSRCLPHERGRLWTADFLLDDWSPHEADKDAAAIVSARRQAPENVYRELETISPQLKAIWRGARWVLGMQGRDGGWGAFDVNNDRELFTRVPFADHNAMIDPSTADITARVLEMLAHLEVSSRHPAVQRAVPYLWEHQESDHCWYGRWGVNYIYGTWQVVVGLTAIGTSPHDARIRQACNWLKQQQQACGGWGETPRSYDDPSLRGQGEPTASQTAWALLGLMAGGEGRSEEVRRGIEYLLETQREDGTWDEPWFTGTGFPRVFYLKYHLYRVYFPLMALARFARSSA